MPKFPIDYNNIRKAIVGQVQVCTQVTCIVEEPETQNVPRPPLPYVSMKIMNPAIKASDDDQIAQPDGSVLYAGQRKMTVDFNCYGRSHEEAYNYMALWQSYLETEAVQAVLRTAGIAVWTIGNVADLSQLLNTGFEGRAHMDCSFGIAMNIISGVGTIDSAQVEAQVGEDVLEITVQGSN